MSLSEENRPWSHCFEEHREGLLQQAAQKLSPVLQRRITAEDVVQETLLNACKRQAFFENRPEIPTFRKLLIVLEQTLAALERRHLQSGKRDIYKEVAVQTAIGSTPNQLNWGMFADSAAGPLTQVAKQDRLQLIRNVINNMPENDKNVLTLRLLQGKSNEECATALGITTKNASIRFVRAAQRLQAELSQFTQIS